jgi:hypothetical protein
VHFGGCVVIESASVRWLASFRGASSEQQMPYSNTGFECDERSEK